MSDHYFADIPQPGRSGKPRTRGVTFVIDWGIGPRQQEDLLNTAGTFIDLAKIAVGIAGLLRADVVREKIELYQRHDVEPFPGGQFLEHAHISGADEAYLPAAAEAGFRWVEVSDNMADVTLDWKATMIRRAVRDYDMHVLGEVGKKAGGAGGAHFVDDAKVCRDAGATFVLLEAAELVSDDPAVQRDVDAVVETIGIDHVMFELPGPWIDGVHGCDIHAMRRKLIAQYGPEVNIGNCDSADIVSLEAYRRKLGVNAGGGD
jgi:phosphosulfolactate synthase